MVSSIASVHECSARFISAHSGKHRKPLYDPEVAVCLNADSSRLYESSRERLTNTTAHDSKHSESIIPDAILIPIPCPTNSPTSLGRMAGKKHTSISLIDLMFSLMLSEPQSLLNAWCIDSFTPSVYRNHCYFLDVWPSVKCQTPIKKEQPRSRARSQSSQIRRTC